MDDEDDEQLDDEVEMTRRGQAGIMFLPLRLDRGALGISQPRSSGEPSRSLEEGREPLVPGAGGAGLVVQDLEVEELVLDDVEELGLGDEAVDELLVFVKSLEGAEDPVPNDEDPGVVLIEAVPVGTMVDLH